MANVIIGASQAPLMALLGPPPKADKGLSPGSPKAPPTGPPVGGTIKNQAGPEGQPTQGGQTETKGIEPGQIPFGMLPGIIPPPPAPLPPDTPGVPPSQQPPGQGDKASEPGAGANSVPDGIDLGQGHWFMLIGMRKGTVGDAGDASSAGQEKGVGAADKVGGGTKETNGDAASGIIVLPPPGRQNTINPDSVIRNSGAVANAGDATVADGKPPGDGVSGTQVLPPPGKIGNDEIGRGHWKMLIGSKSGTVDQIGAKETGDTTKTTGGEQTGGAGTQKINGNLGSDLKIDPPPGGGGGKDGTGTDSNSGAKSTGDVDVRQGHYFALAGKTKLSAGDAGGDLAAAGPDADGTGSIGTNDGAKSTGGVGTEQGHYFALAGKTKLSAGDAGGDLAAAGPDAGSTGTNRVVVQAEAVAASDLTVPVRLQQIHLLGRPELTAVNIQQSTAGGLIDAFAEDRGDGKPADAPKRNLIPSQLFNAAYAPPQEVTQSRSATFRPVERTA